MPHLLIHYWQACKRDIHLKIKILPSITHRQGVTLSSEEHKLKYFKECWGPLTFFVQTKNI